MSSKSNHNPNSTEHEIRKLNHEIESVAIGVFPANQKLNRLRTITSANSVGELLYSEMTRSRRYLEKAISSSVR